jgi:probable addiction module antidote protein
MTKQRSAPKARRRGIEIAPFDASDYLDSEEVIAEYLAAALEDSNPNVFLRAVADVAKARGIAKVAADAGLGRESLYKALAPGAKIRYETVRKLMDSLGVRLTVAAQKAA